MQWDLSKGARGLCSVGEVAKQNVHARQTPILTELSAESFCKANQMTARAPTSQSHNH